MVIISTSVRNKKAQDKALMDIDILFETQLGNQLSSWLLSLVLTVAVLIVLRSLRSLIVRRLEHVAHGTSTQIDDLAISLLRSSRSWFFLSVSLYIGTLSLDLPGGAENLVRLIVILTLLLQAALWANQIIDYGLQQYARHTLEPETEHSNTVSILGLAIRIVLWSIILLLALDNLGIEISGLLAGLGIGGIAIALAVQNILSDLLAYVSITLDRPFKIGDFIVVDDHMGTVEQIGLKTTRIRSLSGEMIIFANHDLLGSRMRNFQDREERRVVFTIGVTYDTPAAKLTTIPAILNEVITAQEQVRFDRAHFSTFSDSSLDFETAYYVTSADYAVYMDVQQAVNLEIVRRFEQHGIEFAFPTHTVHLKSKADTS